MPPQRANYPNSLTARVERYFLSNPDEYLTYADMSIKFNCTEKQARIVVMHLKKLDVLQTSHVVHKLTEPV